MLVIAMAMTATISAGAAGRPNIHILATGGTIAGTGNSATGSGYLSLIHI